MTNQSFTENNYGDYIIYGDETGDHSIKNIYKEHPVFALVLCIFRKRKYISEAVANFKNLKFAFWGHDTAILHSAKIRKKIEDFNFLQNSIQRMFFIDALNNSIKDSSFNIISAAIDKMSLKEHIDLSFDLYTLSLESCLKGVYQFLQDNQQYGKITHIVLESRGNKLDNELCTSFHRIVDHHKDLQVETPLKLIFADKKSNAIGLQIADLVAYPIGRHVIDSTRENRAFDLILEKFYRYPDYHGNGLIIIPGERLGTFTEKRKAPDFSEASTPTRTDPSH